MKQKFIFTLLLSFIASFMFVSEAKDRIIKITAEPAEAAIYVDNVFSGNGFAEFTCPKNKNSVAVIKIECDGYKTVNSRFYGGDKRESVAFKLVPDGLTRGSVPSGVVNKFFTIQIDPKYYTKNEDGTYNTMAAWKLLHQVLLNYYDEIQTTDFYSGYVQTPWHYTKFSMSDKEIRTRVTIRDISNKDLVAFQIKVSSEVAASSFSGKTGEFEEIARIPKDFQPLIEELQTRIGKLHNL